MNEPDVISTFHVPATGQYAFDVKVHASGQGLGIGLFDTLIPWSVILEAHRRHCGGDGMVLGSDGLWVDPPQDPKP
jgi:hypothetical protein